MAGPGSRLPVEDRWNYRVEAKSIAIHTNHTFQVIIVDNKTPQPGLTLNVQMAEAPQCLCVSVSPSLSPSHHYIQHPGITNTTTGINILLVIHHGFDKR